MVEYVKLELREDLKDYQLARMMNWIDPDSKTPISKDDLALIKILRRYGCIIISNGETLRYDDIAVVGYPMRYTKAYSPKEPDDLRWMAINSEILKPIK